MPLTLFDLDDTLIDRGAAFGRWADRFVASRRLGGRSDVDWLEVADNGGVEPREVFFSTVRARYGIVDEIDDLVAAYWRDYVGCIEPAGAQTVDALGRLRSRGWTIGIVTNGAPAQAEVIVAARLADLVDGWAVSEVVGARKPDPAIFRVAAETCGCALDGGWMVGDSPSADIAGGVACGLGTVWIGRGREWEPSAPYRPDEVVDTAAEAVDVILSGRF